MKRVRIKICGITTRDALEAAVEAGADAIGFVMSDSPRQLEAGAVAELMTHLPPWVASVVVTRQPPARFTTTLATLAPDWWQTDRRDLDVAAPAGVRVVPVIREGESTDDLPDAFVYEGAQSGHGQTVDWSTAAGLARRGRLILAGGLTPDNVAAAIAAVGPWAVDVSSGVESQRGIKDAGLIHEFVAAVHAA